VAAKSATLASLGRAVRAIRAERALSQEELGFRSGLNRTYVGDVERGERNPSYQSLLKLADGLDVDASQVLARAERLRRETPRLR
jgi:transcriptional regulator with XRE-family HTH domain